MYIKNSFSNVSFEQLLFSMQTAKGTGSDMIINGAIYIIPKLLLINFLIFSYIIFKKRFLKNQVLLNCYFKGKCFSLNIFPLSLKMRIIFLIMFIIISLIYVFNSIGLTEYLFFNNDTHFFEKYYVDPSSVKVTAPSKKRNLIYIYVESLETSLFSKDNGGNFNQSIIPGLEKLAKDNVNFSGSNRLGGAVMLPGTTWTIAGIIAQSAGIPLKLATLDGNIYWNYDKIFLPGAYTLGEILENNDYNNYFLLGSNAGFGGRNLYFSQHGNYKIYDYEYALKNGWIDKDYNVWWGFEDSKLYSFAKEELLKISESNNPFNFTILTADTHPIDGYLDSSCSEEFDEAYLNSFACADNMLSEFISWLEKQDFYDNTTIVIVGDHLSMQNNLSDMFDVNNDRYIYNVFINSNVDYDYERKRLFSSMDIYPTVLSALGFKIEGDRLGVGTNLFSDRKTIAEEIGVEKLSDEISHKSQYYNQNIVKDEQISEK